MVPQPGAHGVELADVGQQAASTDMAGDSRQTTNRRRSTKAAYVDRRYPPATPWTEQRNLPLGPRRPLAWGFVVELRGIEPLTPSMPWKCSAN